MHLKIEIIDGQLHVNGTSLEREPNTVESHLITQLDEVMGRLEKFQEAIDDLGALSVRADNVLNRASKI